MTWVRKQIGDVAYRVYAPSGEKVVKGYEMVVDPMTGSKHLIEGTSINHYEKIQASKAQCDINNIISRYTLGDTSALNRYTLQYIDALGAPASLSDAMNQVIRARQAFDSLPVDVRAKFGFDPIRFVNEIGSEGFAEKLGQVDAKVVVPTQPAVPTQPVKSEVIE